MREHRKMTLKRIGIGILCMVFVLSMLAPLVAFAEEKQSPEVRCQRESLRTFRSVSATGRRRLCLRRGRRYPSFGSM